MDFIIIPPFDNMTNIKHNKNKIQNKKKSQTKNQMNLDDCL